MRNQFVKMPMGLPKLALLLTLRAAAADKPESKPGASLEPDTTLSASAAPTPFGGCCKWSSAGDWCEACVFGGGARTTPTLPLAGRPRTGRARGGRVLDFRELSEKCTVF